MSHPHPEDPTPFLRDLADAQVETYYTWEAEVLEETRASLADFSGQTLGIDEECRAQRMIECENWDEEN